MSEGLNRAQILGRLSKDVELRFSQNNQAVLNFSVVTNESYFDEKSKSRKELTAFHNCVLWGKRAEALNKFLSKGSQVYVEGRLQTRSWNDKTGAKRYTTEIVASNVILLGGKGERAEAPASEPAGSGYGQQQAQVGTTDDDFGDIPFAVHCSELPSDELSLGKRLI